MDGLTRYKHEWGNYKSDKHKSKRILSAEISDIMSFGEFSKTDLIDIKDFAYSIAFDKEEPNSMKENSKEAMVKLAKQIGKINQAKKERNNEQE